MYGGGPSIGVKIDVGPNSNTKPKNIKRNQFNHFNLYRNFKNVSKVPKGRVLNFTVFPSISYVFNEIITKRNFHP